MTRARLFSKGFGGGAVANANISLADILPFLTTANVAEITPNVYYSNARVFANIELASINDLFDVDTTTITLIDDVLKWDGTKWRPGRPRANLQLSTTDDLQQGNVNFYFSNALARRAFTAGTPSIVIDWNLGTISANLQAVAASSNTTDTLPEGVVNLYYRDSRAHANLKLAKISDLSDVYSVGDQYPAGHPNYGFGTIPQLNTGAGLVWYAPSNAWIAGTITAEIANSYNKDVFAFPGRTIDLGSMGCNHLIRTHRANLITSGLDFIEFMNWDPNIKKKKSIQAELFLSLEGREKELYELILAREPVAIDDLIVQSGQKSSEVSAQLFSLEMRGLVAIRPGKLYAAVYR
jgi:hypothetical protein